MSETSQPSPSVNELFLRARDAWEQSRRWSSYTILVLLLFDVTAIIPFVHFNQGRQAAEADVERLKGAEVEISQLSKEMDAIGSSIESSTHPLLQQLVDDLSADLKRVDATRRYARRVYAEASGSAAGAESGAGEDASEGATAPLQIDNPDWIVALAEAETPAEVLAATEPVVEERVVRPRFEALNQVWTGQVLPQIESRIDALAGKIPGLRSRFPQADASWESFAQAVGNLRRTARDLVFKPPERRYWWSSRNDQELVLGIETAAAEQLRQPLALDEVKAATDQALQRYEEVAKLYTDRQAEIEKSVGTGTRGSSEQLVGWLTNNLPMVAGTFTLVLGLLLAALQVWQTQGLRELGLLSFLMIEEGASPRLGRWYLSHLCGWSLTDPPQPRGLALRLLLTAALELGWIGVNFAQQLGGGTPLAVHHLGVIAGAGALAVVSSLAYTAVVARSAVRLVAGRIAGPGWAGEAVAADEPLDGHTLRR